MYNRKCDKYTSNVLITVSGTLPLIPFLILLPLNALMPPSLSFSEIVLKVLFHEYT